MCLASYIEHDRFSAQVFETHSFGGGMEGNIEVGTNVDDFQAFCVCFPCVCMDKSSVVVYVSANGLSPCDHVINQRLCTGCHPDLTQ